MLKGTEPQMVLFPLHFVHFAAASHLMVLNMRLVVRDCSPMRGRAALYLFDFVPHLIYNIWQLVKDIRARSFVFLWGIVPVPTYLYDPSHAAQVVVTICMLLLWLRLRCILLDWFQHSFNFDRFNVVSSCFFSSTNGAVHLTFWPSDVGRVALRLMLIQEPIFACLGNMLLGGRFGELGDSKLPGSQYVSVITRAIDADAHQVSPLLKDVQNINLEGIARMNMTSE